MSHFLERPEFYNQPIWLSIEQKENPFNVFEDFFSDHTLGELREILNDISETCLSTATPPFDDAEKRADLIMYVKQIEMYFEAGFFVLRHRKKLMDEYGCK